MQIAINNNSIEVIDGETILEAARRVGHSIPSLCYAKGAKHKSSCMVCAVKNQANGQIIPSCTTLPTERMHIITDSEDVIQVRNIAMELLLSDHRADCEAPCTEVCPENLDVEHMLGHYDAGRYEKACEVIAGAFPIPEIRCDTCKAPCEKACRRRTVDKPVAIRAIIKEVIGMFDVAWRSTEVINPSKAKYKNTFQSRMGRFTEKEKERLKHTVSTSSQCLHCACFARAGCQLRLYATAANVKRSRYEASSVMSAMDKLHVIGNMWFEPAKCIRCGLCVYNSENGFTFKGKGFGMQVVIPEENRSNINEKLANICPVGALYLIQP